MHMSDALLSPIIGGVTWATTIGVAAYNTKKIDLQNDDHKIPLVGVMGAFVFAAQMINFSIPGTGSSGHLGGGLLLAILLGPELAFITMMSVLMIQALFFADGGLLAYGANVINMGFFACFVAYPYIYKPLIKRIKPAFAAIIASVAGLSMGAFAVVIETTLSGVSALPFGPFLAAMVPVHIAIGIVEGVITAVVVAFVHRFMPAPDEPLKKKWDHLIVGIVIVTLLVGGGLSLFASDRPDGLEYAIENTAQSEVVTTSPVFEEIQSMIAFLPDYSSDAVESETLGTSLSGVVGSAVTVGVLLLVVSLLKRQSKKKKAKEQEV